MAEGDAAVHAARALLAEVPLAEGDDEFLVMLEPVRDRGVGPVLAGVFHEAGGLAHER